MKTKSAYSLIDSKAQRDGKSYRSSGLRFFRAFANARSMRSWRPCAATIVFVAAAFAALEINSSSAHAQFPASIDLRTLDGKNGFVINGIAVNDSSGRSVSGAGDINGDGIEDLIIGADGADGNSNLGGAGESYVVFGSDIGFSSSLDLIALDGTNGFLLNGIDTNDQSGVSVSGAGDVNGDGIADVIIGASNADLPGVSVAGASYVVFGQTGSFSAEIDLDTLNGSNGFTINGISFADRSGGSVSGAGDINGDGVDDLIIGARGADFSTGETYVVFGQSDGFSSSLNLSTLDGTNGFTLLGISSGDQSGVSVSGVGDFNGDGLDDLIIGANSAPRGLFPTGETYIVFGKTDGFAPTINLSGLNGANGFVLNGVDEFDQSGLSVSGAGDFNGDGINDVVIGALSADPGGKDSAGASYVVFGNSTGFSRSFNLSSLDGSNGFVINGVNAGDGSGRSVSSAGDVNCDGFDDIIIGNRALGASVAGASYVVFGRGGVVASSLDLSTLDGTNGFAISGIDVDDFSGSSGSGAGDINGDGIDDLIIGAFGADPNGNSSAGESYVVFGRVTPEPLIGDVNQDGIINFLDIAPFISLLSSNSFLEEADINEDGEVDFLDIGSFINLLSSQQ